VRQDKILEMMKENSQEHKEIVVVLGKLNVGVAKIEEHLKALNGTVVRHEKRLDKVDEKVLGINKRVAYFGGAFAVIFSLINLAFKIFF